MRFPLVRATWPLVICLAVSTTAYGWNAKKWSRGVCALLVLGAIRPGWTLINNEIKINEYASDPDTKCHYCLNFNRSGIRGVLHGSFHSQMTLAVEFPIGRRELDAAHRFIWEKVKRSDRYFTIVPAPGAGFASPRSRERQRAHRQLAQLLVELEAQMEAEVESKNGCAKEAGWGLMRRLLFETPAPDSKAWKEMERRGESRLLTVWKMKEPAMFDLYPTLVDLLRNFESKEGTLHLRSQLRNF